MTILPAEVVFGFIKFRASLALADTADADRHPDAAGAVGTVTFTAKSPVTKVYEAGEPVTIGKQVIDCPLDSEGHLLERVGGQRGVFLIVGEYVVTYDIVGMTLPTHDILVETSHTEVAPLYLADYIPPGPQASISEYTELSGRLLELESYPKITASPVGSPPANPELNQIWVKY